MTDKQIIKALECCKDGECRCKECPYGVSECLTEDDVSIILKDAFDLINRQKAEIERLKAELKELDKPNCSLEEVQQEEKEQAKYFNLAVECARDKAIKEFAERLKTRFNDLSLHTKTREKRVPVNKIDDTSNWVLHEVVPKEIDNLVKEMTEEQNEKRT